MSDSNLRDPIPRVGTNENSDKLLSVVMPYYKNARTLITCIRSFTEQTIPPENYEIILVDDEAEPTAKALLVSAGFHHVQVIETGHCGQVRATNRGIDAACGKFLLLTCADIIASPGLLERHLKLQQNTEKLCCVTGPIAYPEEYNTSPFMRYLLRTGRQFRIPPNAQFNECGLAWISPDNLYAPNFSIKRSVLQECGAFSEEFDYGFQDTDLGIRLDKANDIDFVFDKAAMAYHDHPTTIEDYANREFRMGKNLATFRRFHPEKYSDEPIREREASDLRDAPRYFPELPRYISQAHEWENSLKSEPSYQGFRELFRFYDVILDLYRLAGVADNTEELTEFYGFDSVEADLIRASAHSIAPVQKQD